MIVELADRPRDVPSLLTLPLELRNLIYHYLFVGTCFCFYEGEKAFQLHYLLEHSTWIPHSSTDKLQLWHHSKWSPDRSTGKLELWLRTNKQVFVESREQFYRMARLERVEDDLPPSVLPSNRHYATAFLSLDRAVNWFVLARFISVEAGISPAFFIKGIPESLRKLIQTTPPRRLQMLVNWRGRALRDTSFDLSQLYNLSHTFIEVEFILSQPRVRSVYLGVIKNLPMDFARLQRDLELAAKKLTDFQDQSHGQIIRGGCELAPKPDVKKPWFFEHQWRVKAQTRSKPGCVSRVEYMDLLHITVYRYENARIFRRLEDGEHKTALWICDHTGETIQMRDGRFVLVDAETNN